MAVCPDCGNDFEIDWIDGKCGRCGLRYTIDSMGDWGSDEEYPIAIFEDQMNDNKKPDIMDLSTLPKLMSEEIKACDEMGNMAWEKGFDKLETSPDECWRVVASESRIMSSSGRTMTLTMIHWFVSRDDADKFIKRVTDNGDKLISVTHYVALRQATTLPKD